MICLSVPGLFSAVVLILPSLLFLMTLGPGDIKCSRPLEFKVIISIFDYL